MSAVVANIAAHVAGHVDTYKEQLRHNRLGLWLFFISEAFLFGCSSVVFP